MATISRYETKAGTRWRVRYRKPDGSQTMQRGFKTKRDATEWWENTSSSMRAGEFVSKSDTRTLVSELAERWFETKAIRKASTRSNYRQALDKHVVPKWGQRKLQSITHDEVQAWISELHGHLGPSSIRPPFIALSGIFKHAIRSGKATRNPCVGVQLPRLHRKTRPYLSHQQVKTLVEAMVDYKDLVQLLAYSGLRIGEAAALRAQDIDLAKKRVLVQRAVSDVRGQLVWDTPKGNESRTVAIPGFVAADLNERIDDTEHDGLLFTAPGGGPLRHPNFRQRFFNRAVAACIEADPTFPRVTPHDLRHTAASLAVSAGANVKALQRMLGHKDAAMTLNVYADLFEDDLDGVAVALEAARNNAA